MKMKASLTVQRVPAPPEQVEIWRAGFEVLLELFEQFQAERRALPVLEGEQYASVEG